MALTRLLHTVFTLMALTRLQLPRTHMATPTWRSHGDTHIDMFMWQSYAKMYSKKPYLKLEHSDGHSFTCVAASV